MKKRSSLLLGAISSVIAIVFTLAVLEIAVRFFPVGDATMTPPVNDSDPVIHFAPNRDITYSKGWDFDIVARKHVNNYGYLSDEDYARDRIGRLLTVIGDSYVEAMQVGNKESVHGILNTKVYGKGAVYGLGISGSPLSQYLAFGRFARDEFQSDGYVFIIIGNDFDESLDRPGSKPGMNYFRSNPEGNFELVRKDYVGPGMIKKLVRSSALARYLLITSGINTGTVATIFSDKDKSPEKYVGNTAASADAERLQQSFQVVDTFLEMVGELAVRNRDNVMFVIDGIRPQLYSDVALQAARGSYFETMREYFMGRARDAGYEVVDMQSVFRRHHAEHGQVFEFENDGHWNALGHELAAQAIENSQVFARVFGNNGMGSPVVR